MGFKNMRVIAKIKIKRTNSRYRINQLLLEPKNKKKLLKKNNKGYIISIYLKNSYKVPF